MELEQEIIAVAKFMGLSPVYSADEITGWENKHGEMIILGNYAPHADMNELMAVVERITDLKFEDGDFYHVRTFGMRDENGFRMVRFNRHPLHSAVRLVEALWEAVVDVITNLPNPQTPTHDPI